MNGDFIAAPLVESATVAAAPVRRSTVKQHKDIRFLMKQRGIPTHFATDQHHDIFVRAGIAYEYGKQLEPILRAADYEVAALLIQAIREIPL